ncbi:MAG: type II secretion system secretin GspD [Betaproteobacteria bacterium]|nr:type II secretion system secretin GspD [Betaproteobacteria bacterium]
MNDIRTLMTPLRFRQGLACSTLLLLAACAQQPIVPGAPEVGATKAAEAVPAAPPARAAATSPGNDDRARIFRGNGIVVRGQGVGGVLPPGPPAAAPGGPVVLNFEGADLREVVRNVLGDILHQGYEIDPRVGGQVTIRTSAGIPREALPATLETLLRMNGATMVREDNLWKIVPESLALRGNVTPQLGSSTRALPAGFSVQIVPLKYVGAAEMARLLEPFARDAQAVRVDINRNLLILSGTERELRHLIETIDTFDIDWMKGMSAGVFTLQNADVKTVSQELDKVLGDRATSPFAGVLRVIPIERMNALLVISPNQEYVDQAKQWIERLDSGSGEGTRFYVYNMKYQRAERIAPLLQQAFSGRASQPAAPAAPTLAPGPPAGTIVSPPTFQAQPMIQPNTPAAAAAQAAPSGTPFANGIGSAGGVGGAGGSGGAPGSAAPGRLVGGEGTAVVRNIQVVADKEQDSILIVATPSEYSVIEQALKKLDVPARQVMIEVTIAEVKLTDQFGLGVDWLFKGAAPSGRGSGGMFQQNAPFNPAVPLPTTAAGAAASGLAVAAQGFSYLINNANFPGGVQAALNLLDTYGNTKVISNPHIAALDNQKATIKSGNRIPVSQQTIVGNTTNAVTTTSQYIDTGVLLQVTPHINEGGLVTLDVQAEVSSPGNPASAGAAPPIDTRSVQTMLAVPSGDTMVMGGLIQEQKGNATNGLPYLDRLPVIGGLFGNQTLTNNRTELVLFITPRVITDPTDFAPIIEDLRNRMQGLGSVFPSKADKVSGKPDK